MPLWPFKKKSAPNHQFTINKNFYCSVLGASPSAPTLLQIINPDGSNGAVAGFGAPLSSGASKDLLNQPLASGAYVLSTKSRSTLIAAHVFRRSEVPGFSLPSDPEALEVAGLKDEKLRRAQSANFIINVVFSAFDPEFYPSVRFFLDCVIRFGELFEGVIADPLAEVYRLPQELRISPKLDDRIDFREIASVKIVLLEGAYWVSTRGLVKFNMPEFEMYGVPNPLLETAAKMLISAGQQALIGIPMHAGETAFAPHVPMTLVNGTKMRQDWGDRPTLEFLDETGGSAKGIEAWKVMG